MALKAHRLMDNPALLFCLTGFSFALMLAWQRLESSTRAPQISSYNWAQHPRALLIAYPLEGCGCGLPLASWVDAGLKHGRDVIVIAASPQKEVLSLKQRYSSQLGRLHIVTNPDRTMLQKWATQERPGAALIQDGQVLRHIKNEVPPDEFFS